MVGGVQQGFVKQRMMFQMDIEGELTIQHELDKKKERDLDKQTALERVQKMAESRVVEMYAREKELIIQNVVWNTLQVKGVSFETKISDLTLQIKEDGKDVALPVIRRENFSEDAELVLMDSFSVLVKNDVEKKLETKLLKEYLSDFSKYDISGHVKGRLVGEHEFKVSHFVQACLLPLDKENSDKETVSFNVSFNNNPDYVNGPATIVIIGSWDGTSVQIVDDTNEFKNTKLYFNDNGKRRSFIAHQSHDLWNRKLFIIQIPIKEIQANLGMPFEKVDDESFDGLKGLIMERDFDNPIHITTQICVITQDGKMTQEFMEKIAKEIESKEFIKKKSKKNIPISEKPSLRKSLPNLSTRENKKKIIWV